MNLSRFSLDQIKNFFDQRLLMFLILPITAFGLISWFLVNIFYIHQQDIKASLEIESAKVESIMLDKIQSTFSIAKSMNLQIAEYPKNKNKINEILKKFRATPELNDSFSWTIFSWADSNHKLIVDAEYGITKDNFDLSVRDYIHLAKINPGKFYLGNPVYGSTSGKWMIPAGIGLRDENGNYLGSLVIGFEIDSLARSFQKIIDDKNIEFELISDSGKSILQVNSSYFGASKENLPSSNPEIAKEIELINQSNLDSAFKISLIKNKKAFLVKKIKNLPYLIILNYNKESLNNQIWKAFTSRLIEILIMLFSSLILIALIYRFEKRQQNLIIAKNLAEATNAAKDRILSSISHDIKNYIFGISGLGRIILNSKKESHLLENEDLQMIEAICKQAEELKYFVEDLLDINQIKAGDFVLGEKVDIDLRPMINSLITINRPLIAKHSVIIKTDFEENLPLFKCDPRRIKQILMNVITNSIKYNKVGGQTLISVKHLKENNQIYIEVADQGFGMNEEEVEKYLSKKGKEIDKSEIIQTKELDSHGIGVPIILRLVELHHGRIEVESKKGFGTKIKLYFDVADSTRSEINEVGDSSEISKRQLTAENQRDIKKDKKILLVEDNPVNIKITSQVLRKKGYEVISAINGAEALKLIDQEKFDLILMDGEMPIMDGYETTKKIRQGKIFKNFQNFKSIPIIALMSASDQKTIDRAMESGMNSHVEKSASFQHTLLELIEKFLRSAK
ncbi:MAG: hybrid sensor histidine kinase/response regulator [Proteobacteria bacterium]|nr:hybrid sensor histidine kinase/response regulator [Pseudomonadota bacterium]